MKVLLVGHIAGKNYGDDLIFDCTMRALRLYLGRCIRFVLLVSKKSRVPWDDVEVCTYGSHIGRVIASVRAVKDVEAVLVGGGGILQDLFSPLRPASYLLPGIVAAFVGGRFVCLNAVGYGPVRRGCARRIIALACRRFHLLTARDHRSCNEIFRLTGRRVEMVADPALLASFFYPQFERGTPKNQLLCFVRQLKMTRNLARRIAEAVVTFCRSRPVSVVVSATQPSDIPAVKMVAESMRSLGIKPAVRLPKDHHDLLRMVAESALIVSMFLHPIIVSFSYRRPAVGLVADRKINAFMEMVGLGGRCLMLRNLSSRQLADLMQAAVVAGGGDEHVLQEIQRTVLEHFARLAAKIKNPPHRRTVSWNDIIYTASLFTAGYISRRLQGRQVRVR